MAGTRKHPAELRERAVTMVVEWRQEHPGERGAIKAVADRLGVNPETLRNWTVQAEVDSGERPGVP
ncbi:MAG: transposase, partial [Nocardioidaceae bacterium]